MRIFTLKSESSDIGKIYIDAYCAQAVLQLMVFRPRQTPKSIELFTI